MEVFKAPSPLAPIRRAALTLRTLTLSQSEHTDGLGDGERPGGETQTATHNNIMWKSTEIRAIGASAWLSAGRSGVFRAALPLYEEWLVPHRGRGGGSMVLYCMQASVAFPLINQAQPGHMYGRYKSGHGCFKDQSFPKSQDHKIIILLSQDNGSFSYDNRMN